jgi:hypothetical protein
MATPHFGNVETSSHDTGSQNLNGKKNIRGPYKLKKHKLDFNSSCASSMSGNTTTKRHQSTLIKQAKAKEILSTIEPVSEALPVS